MPVRELHLALRGIAGATDGGVLVRLDVAIWISDAPPVFDGITVAIPVRDGAVYKTPAEVNTAIVAAAKTELARADGWSIPDAYDAAYLYGDVHGLPAPA